jgi:hypothetical protein
MAEDIPKEINGWVAHPEVRRYGRKTLFKYIDGGAELYLAYRFHKVYVHTYTKAEEPDIIMDIYDMSTPEDAFGVFTAEREGDDIGIGMEVRGNTGKQGSYPFPCQSSCGHHSVDRGKTSVAFISARKGADQPFHPLFSRP